MRHEQQSKKPEHLLSEAAARLRQQRPGMTLRAVATKLGVTPSYWSKILRGKKPISSRLLPKAARVLHLDGQQLAELQRAILGSIEENRLSPATGIQTTSRKLSPVESYRNLNQDTFWVLSDWYYIPLLNLLTLTGVDPRPEILAKHLGLELGLVESALNRLCQAGLVGRSAGNVFHRTDEKVRFPTDRSHPEIRRFHQLMLARAKAELEKATTHEEFAQRLISSVSFVGPKEKLPQARLILEEAMYRVANLMADSPASDELFHLGLQLFPLSKK